MIKKLKKPLTALLVLCMVLALSACNSKTKKSEETNANSTEQPTDAAATETPVTTTGTYDTLVIGTGTFNGVFSPFFSETAYDKQAIETVFSNLTRLNKDNEVIDWAGSIKGEQIKAEDGHDQVLYTVKIKEGMTFSDGVPVTIDDVLFYYYVLADPSYDGYSTFNTLNIVGLPEYHYDTPDYTKKLEEIAKKVEDISDDEVKTYILTYCQNDYDASGEEAIIEYIKSNEGFEDFSGTGKEDVSKAYADIETKNYWEDYKAMAQTELSTTLTKEYIAENMNDGVDVETISGITRVDDYTCTVLYDEINVIADRNLDAYLTPKHYYGVDFKKGDLSKIKELNGAPLGSGSYVFQGYEDNIVTVTANPNYFEGAPKIPTIKYQVVSSNAQVDAVLNQEVDITDPSASQEVIDQLEAGGIEYSLVDNNGYGYIAISAETLPDKNLRKGLMHLMNRGPAVEAYYGDLAEVIERPMTTTLAEYPDDATEYYGYDPAKALEYFETAGYTKDSSGKLVDSNGKQLKFSVGIGGSGTMNHPSGPILTQMANDLEAMGAELIIHDVEFAQLMNMRNSGELDMWCMAWGNANDCDLTQIFSSKGGSNDVGINDSKLDELIAKSLVTLDLEERKKIVAEELDIIMDWAVYMPIYQRKNMIVYNPTVVKTSTLPSETTTYWNYTSEIINLELN